MYRSPRSLYNTIAQKYHDNRHKAVNDLTELPKVLELLGDLEGKCVLDMGCGLGHHSKEFIKRGAEVTGYDASEKMVAYTKQFCGSKGKFFVATHEKVEFEPESFEVINASFSLMYCQDLKPVFKKMSIWIKPGGVVTFSIPHPVWLLSRVENMDYSKPSKIWIKMKHYDIEVFNYYYPLETYFQLIKENGFELQNLVETVLSRRYQGWPEEKYRLPNSFVFKLQKMV